MNLLSAAQIKEADQHTIQTEEISSIELMEIAGNQLYQSIIKNHSLQKSFTIFCGPGNNGGDGLVIARLLKEKKKSITIYILKGNYSIEFEYNFKRIKDQGINYFEIENSHQIKQLNISNNDIVIDALYGIGLTRPLDGKAAELVKKINEFKNYKIAIDVPSGLSPDYMFSCNNSNCIKANETLSLQLPKLAFFFAENNSFIGNWKCIDIGLSEEFIANQNCNYSFARKSDIQTMIKPRSSFGHKGTFGHSLIIAGSSGKLGASILSSKAALKTGCGLVSACIPDEAITPLLSHVPEIMTLSRQKSLQLNFDDYNTIGFGPGVGIDLINSQLLEQLIVNYNKPLIIDADGITILSHNRHLYDALKPTIILTPHPGEFDRLTHQHTDTYDRLQTQIRFSKKYNVYILLKGKYSSITSPDGKVWFNTTGNSGMATAGSGDVLTGIITSLCAQGYSVDTASKLGAYLHGYSGDLATHELSQTSLIASDIINYINDFFVEFEKQTS